MAGPWELQGSPGSSSLPSGGGRLHSCLLGEMTVGCRVGLVETPWGCWAGLPCQVLRLLWAMGVSRADRTGLRCAVWGRPRVPALLASGAAPSALEGPEPPLPSSAKGLSRFCQWVMCDPHNGCALGGRDVTQRPTGTAGVSSSLCPLRPGKLPHPLGPQSPSRTERQRLNKTACLCRLWANGACERAS